MSDKHAKHYDSILLADQARQLANAYIEHNQINRLLGYEDIGIDTPEALFHE